MNSAVSTCIRRSNCEQDRVELGEESDSLSDLGAESDGFLECGGDSEGEGDIQLDQNTRRTSLNYRYSRRRHSGVDVESLKHDS